LKRRDTVPDLTPVAAMKAAPWMPTVPVKQIGAVPIA
jgi:hypothetical protein